MTEIAHCAIANCSGFFGDRLSAAREMVDGGPIDVLTGDWLAELTMGVLVKQRRRDPDTGFARTFVSQMADVLGDCLDRGIKVVSNAGGLNPHGCAAEVVAVAERLGRTVGRRRRRRRRHRGVRSARAAGWTLRTSTPASRFARRTRARRGQRLPGRLGDRRGPQCAARTSWSPAGSPTPPSSSVRRPGTSAGRGTTGTHWPGRSPRPRHRVRRAGDRRQLLVLPARSPRHGPGRLPDRRDRRRRVRGDHQAARYRWRGHRRDGHGAAALRDRRTALPQPRRGHPARHRSPRTGGPGPGPDHRGPRRARAPDGQGRGTAERRLAQRDRPSCSRARTSRPRQSWPRRRSGPRCPVARSRSTTSPFACCGPTGPIRSPWPRPSRC